MNREVRVAVTTAIHVEIGSVNFHVCHSVIKLMKLVKNKHPKYMQLSLFSAATSLEGRIFLVLHQVKQNTEASKTSETALPPIM